MEETELTIGETSTNITEFYKSYKTVEGQVNLNTTTLGYVKTGKLDEDKDGYDIVGIEIGEKKQDSNNEEVFNKFARFTSDKLSFFDDEGEEVAYVSDKRFKMIDAEIEGTLYWGAYKITRSYGLAFKRIGRG